VVVHLKGKRLHLGMLPPDRKERIRDQAAAVLGSKLPVRPPAGKLPANGGKPQSKRDPDLIDVKQVVQVPLKTPGNAESILVLDRLTEPASTGSAEAVDVVLGKIPDPDPNETSVEQLTQALVGSPLGTLEEELRELSSREEPHLP